VVGAGNSGAQIAVELAKAGRKVTLSTTRKPVYSPHRIWGISVFWWFSTLKFYDILTVNTRLGRKLMNLPEPIMGKELNHLLEKGIITLKPKLTSLWSEEAAFEDNSKVKVDSVVWCTGYEWLCHFMQIPDACHEDGLLLHSRGISPIPGLYYVGLPWQHKRTSGLLMGVGDDARYVVTHIKRTLLS
jgi:putative flavoprotein involved in K+ transport